MKIILHWIILALAIFASAYLIPGIHVSSILSVLLAAAVLAFINTIIKPIISLLTLPLNILTLGLFSLILNGLFFWFVSGLISGFIVDTFYAAFWGALVVSTINWIGSKVLTQSMHYLSVFAQIISDYALPAYLLFFLAVAIEGEFTLIMAGVLAHIGVLPVGISIFIGVLGGVAKTTLGYELGIYLSNKYPHSVILRYAKHKVLSFLPRFREQPFWSILLSKFIYGVNHFSIIFAGYIRANFKTYFLAELISSLLWAPGLFLLGYFFSYAAFGLTHDIKKVVLVILVFLILFMLLQKLLTTLITFIEEYYLPEE